MSKRGRKPIAIFGGYNYQINEVATSASNKGAYTVESICPGLVYFIFNDKVTIASERGSMTVHITAAEQIAEELLDIIADFKYWQREGRTPMDSRSIGKMLESDFR